MTHVCVLGQQLEESTTKGLWHNLHEDKIPDAVFNLSHWHEKQLEQVRAQSVV